MFGCGDGIEHQIRGNKGQMCVASLGKCIWARSGASGAQFEPREWGQDTSKGDTALDVLSKGLALVELWKLH